MKHLCDFKIIKETDSGMVEICRECRRKIKFNKSKDGNIDNKKFLKEHRRDFLQNTGITSREFKRYYGNTETEKTSTNDSR